MNWRIYIKFYLSCISSFSLYLFIYLPSLKLTIFDFGFCKKFKSSIPSEINLFAQLIKTVKPFNQKEKVWVFSGGSVEKNLPDHAGEGFNP